MVSLEPISRRTINLMREAFFDVSPEGVLVYLDPMIGPLQSRKHRLALMVNTSTSRIELKYDGVEVEGFELRDNVGQVCQEAATAYFTALQKLCRRQQRQSQPV